MSLYVTDFEYRSVRAADKYCRNKITYVDRGVTESRKMEVLR